MQSKVRAFISVSAGGDELLHTVSLPSVEIPQADYRNETVIAKALRQLADEIQSGCSFQVVRMVDSPPFG